MRHGAVSRRLGVKTGHRVALLRNLLKGLVRDGRIRTTVARAKVLRPYVEKIVTRLKDPSVANIRHVSSLVNDKVAVSDLVHQVAPKFKTRNGGYIRIMKLAMRRPGDNADMALVEWVDESLVEAGLERRRPVKDTVAAKGSKKPAKKAKDKDSEGAEPKAEKKAKKAPAKKASSKK
jgi:large subunit ribosomal protein L17